MGYWQSVLMNAPQKKFSLMNFEWRWSLANMLWGVPTAIASFALPAWAVSATKMFEQYAPASWVAAGFAGLLLASFGYAIAAWARGKWVRSRYDARMLAIGGAIDPLDKTFERKRIYLNEFALPSHPLIEGKTFIDCEIIGPANIVLEIGNSVSEQKYPVCDAALLHATSAPYNGYLFRNCTFRSCSFQRVTFLVPIGEYEGFRGINWVNWITPHPDSEDQIPLPIPPTVQPPAPQSPPSTEEETQP